LIRVPDAYTAFAKLLSTYQQMMQQQLNGVQQPVYISASASYGQNVFIGAFAYLGDNVKVGTIQKFIPMFISAIM
jgi:Nucleoside-diphosphate-sugar pyrophosphorylase involved in lipopolysaccharide biosynthesis/translation initiation factor 2B, gamma/epsilon subunits (eIF-2Bgamma/eIF-2Bepsilon)